MEKLMNIVVTDPSVDKLLKELAGTKAITILSEDELSQLNEIPEWQKEEVRKRVDAFNKNPEDVYSWEEIEQMLIEDEKL